MGKMVHCRSCGAEIASSAKVCPQCGAKNSKPLYMRWWVYVLGIILIVGLFGGTGNKGATKVGEVTTPSSSTSAPSAPTSSESTTPVQEKFSVGDVVELDGLSVTLLSATENTGANYSNPSDGNVFVICEFEIANNSNKEVTISSLMSFDAYCDDYALSYSAGADFASDKKSIGGTVAVGKKCSGTIGWEVPVDWKEVEVTFKPSAWGSKEITFVVNH